MKQYFNKKKSTNATRISKKINNIYNIKTGVPYLLKQSPIWWTNHFGAKSPCVSEYPLYIKFIRIYDDQHATCT